ncbi:MAG: alcohol dehydrogenase catalytic domain-containing protein [Pirellulales bacterium]|nr:alcohol dehydrogenase catalytic domain-containing protein [Pirellulales bacterium]
MLGIAALPGEAAPRLVETAEPGQPAAGQVLCQTIELGVCGTDREILHSLDPQTPAGEPHLILGHECLARIVEVGAAKGDTPSATVGELVVPVVRRAKPNQQRRVDMLAFGQFTERGIYHEHGFSTPYWLDEPRYLVKVPADLAPVAILTEPIAVAEKGINEAVLLQQARLGPGEWQKWPPRVLVTGLGPIGMAALLACRVRGWPTAVYGRDAANSPRAELVRAFSGTYLQADREKFAPVNVERDGYDLLLECTGADEVLLLATRGLASCGVAVWLGSTRTPRPAVHDVTRLMRESLIRNHLHIGCVNAALRDFQRALVDLAECQRRWPGLAARLITDRVAQRESLPHYVDRVKHGIKTVIDYS